MYANEYTCLLDKYTFLRSVYKNVMLVWSKSITLKDCLITLGSIAGEESF